MERILISASMVPTIGPQGGGGGGAGVCVLGGGGGEGGSQLEEANGAPSRLEED